MSGLLNSVMSDKDYKTELTHQGLSVVFRNYAVISYLCVNTALLLVTVMSV
jgi:hypothetical protein